MGNGTVVANHDFGSGFGRALFIRHTAPDATVFTVLYGHISSSLAANASVSAGDQVGTIVDQAAGAHLHLGLVEGTAFPTSNWGRLTCPNWQGTNSFVDPIAFLDAHPLQGGGNPPLPTGSSPIKNGGFNLDTSHWSVSGSANLARYTSVSGTNPYEGAGFAASNASQSGDSFSETNTASISAGDTYCVSAEVVTIGAGSGSSGTLALWLLGSTNDSSTYRYTSLPGSNNWQSIKTCVMATGSRTQIKVQFYPDPGSPTVGIDAIDAHQTLNASGGFNNGTGYWNLQAGTNFTTYTTAQAVGTNPYEGGAFGATNTSQSGGGFMQDLPRSIAPGDTFCTEAKVVTVGNTTGASGALAIYLTGTTATEQSVFHFSGLPGGNAWRNAKACVRAASPHNNIRVQVFPAVNGPTLGVDVLDVHASIALNGGFNVDSTHWSANGSLGYAQFANFNGTLPYEGTGFEIVQTNQAGASLSEGRGWAWGVGDTFCAEAMFVTGGTTSGGGGILALHLIGPSTTDTSTYSFSALPAGNSWSRAKTCVKANSGVGNGVIKVEIYPSTNNLPLGVDAVDVH
ncbi:MAG TPA: hypothetical protein VJM32_03910 [Candidatus Saccharimonadales bacterium]|nr:hypothetical protein [Candidatus Saccharimonadales bacterium]